MFGLIFVVLMIARHKQKPSGNSEGNMVYYSHVLEGRGMPGATQGSLG